MRSFVIGLVAVLAAASLAQAQRSVASLLNLSGSQLVQLEQLYDYVHAVRFQEESKKDGLRDIHSAFDTAQREAKGLLSPGQVYLLENRIDEVRTAPQVQQRLPLVGTFEEFMAKPVDVNAAKRWLDAREQYRREKTRFAFGFGFCGHHHWCNPKKPRCGNGEATGIRPPRSSSASRSSGSGGARGGGSKGGSIGGRG